MTAARPMSATSSYSADVIDSVQRFVTTAQLIKTLLGLLISMVVACLVVYNHFAKTAELSELACKVVEQNQINNEIITSSREIQASLKLFKENFEATADKPVSAKFLAREIAIAVGKIEKSLAAVDQVRKDSQKRAIMKDGKC